MANILVVDDDAENREILKLRLEQAGYDELRAFESGADDYLTKPWEAARLLEAAGNLLAIPRAGGAQP